MLDNQKLYHLKSFTLFVYHEINNWAKVLFHGKWCKTCVKIKMHECDNEPWWLFRFQYEVTETGCWWYPSTSPRFVCDLKMKISLFHRWILQADPTINWIKFNWIEMNWIQFNLSRLSWLAGFILDWSDGAKRAMIEYSTDYHASIY